MAGTNCDFSGHLSKRDAAQQLTKAVPFETTALDGAQQLGRGNATRDKADTADSQT